MINIRDYGAIGDGVTDDREAIQRALNTAGASADNVYVPDGTYLVRQGAGFFCLSIPPAVTLYGNNLNSSIVQAGGLGSSVRLLHAQGGGITVAKLSLWSMPQDNFNEHRAGIFVTNCPDFTASELSINSFTGDGIYVHTGSNNCLIHHCKVFDNFRDGVAFGGGSDGASISKCEILHNRAQQIDSEPGFGTIVSNVIIEDCCVQGRGDYAVTISGSSGSFLSKNWTIKNCNIDGSIRTVWADGIRLLNNSGWNEVFDKPTVEVYRTVKNFLAMNNSFRSKSKAIVGIKGISVDEMPSDIHIYGNDLMATTRDTQFGIEVRAARSVFICNNIITQPYDRNPTGAGVYARSTLASTQMESVVVKNNTISGFGKYGVYGTGNPGTVAYMGVVDNVFNGYIEADAFELTSEVLTSEVRGNITI